MTALSYNIPEVGQPDKTEDPKIASALKAILAWSQGSISASNLANEGIEGANIKKGTISGDELAVSKGVYEALKEFTLNAKHLASSTHPVFVKLLIQSPRQLPIIEAKILVGGVEVNKIFLAGEEAERAFTDSFICPANVEWEVKGINSNAFKVYASYLVI